MKKYRKEIALLAVCIAVFMGVLCMLVSIWICTIRNGRNIGLERKSIISDRIF